MGKTYRMGSINKQRINSIFIKLPYVYLYVFLLRMSVMTIVGSSKLTMHLRYILKDNIWFVFPNWVLYLPIVYFRYILVSDYFLSQVIGIFIIRNRCIIP